MKKWKWTKGRSETEEARAREIETSREAARWATRDGTGCGGAAEASPPGGPSAPEKRVNIDPFFYLSHPQVFHPRYFFFPWSQGSPRRGAGATETELVFL